MYEGTSQEKGVIKYHSYDVRRDVHESCEEGRLEVSWERYGAPVSKE